MSVVWGMGANAPASSHAPRMPRESAKTFLTASSHAPRMPRVRTNTLESAETFLAAYCMGPYLLTITIAPNCLSHLLFQITFLASFPLVGVSARRVALYRKVAVLDVDFNEYRTQLHGSA